MRSSKMRKSLLPSCSGLYQTLGSHAIQRSNIMHDIGPRRQAELRGSDDDIEQLKRRLDMKEMREPRASARLLLDPPRHRDAPSGSGNHQIRPRSDERTRLAAIQA